MTEQNDREQLMKDFERDCPDYNFCRNEIVQNEYENTYTRLAFEAYLAGCQRSDKVIREMANQIEGMEALINEYVDELNELRGALIGKKQTRSRLPDGVQTATDAATGRKVYDRDADAQPVVKSVRPSLWEQRHEIAKAEAQPVAEDRRCQCSMSISMLGDGCRYCQPQEYIDRLHDQIEEDRAEAQSVRPELDVEALTAAIRPYTSSNYEAKAAAKAICRELAMPVKPDVDVVARIISDGMGINTRTITDIAETICARFAVPAGDLDKRMAELLPYCPQCGVKLFEIEDGRVE